jgi:hypothetical protein
LKYRVAGLTPLFGFVALMVEFNPRVRALLL